MAEIIDSEATPTFIGAVDHLIEKRLSDVHIACPAKVLAYHEDRNTVDVQPVISRAFVGPDGTRQVESFPAISDVPLLHLGAGSFSLRFTPVKNDEVFLIFASCSLDKWEATGTGGDPDDDRRFTLSDAIAIPGIRPFNKPIASTYPSIGPNASGIEVQFRGGTVDVASVGTSLGSTDEVVHGTGVDPFTGSTYKVLGNTTAKLRAEK